jgi:hypothetical protein
MSNDLKPFFDLFSIFSYLFEQFSSRNANFYFFFKNLGDHKKVDSVLKRYRPFRRKSGGMVGTPAIFRQIFRRNSDHSAGFLAFSMVRSGTVF